MREGQVSAQRWPTLLRRRAVQKNTVNTGAWVTICPGIDKATPALGLEVQEKKNKGNTQCDLAERNLPFIVFSIQMGHQINVDFSSPAGHHLGTTQRYVETP